MVVDKIVTQKEQLEITGSTLLSIEEAEQLPLRLRKYTCRWWLRSPSHYSEYATYVYRSGDVDYFGDYVDINSSVIRPALHIKNLKSSNLNIGDVFKFGGKQFEIISDTLAFCLGDIGEHCFRGDCEAPDANDYGQSDIKEYIDYWFMSTIKDCEVRLC